MIVRFRFAVLLAAALSPMLTAPVGAQPVPAAPTSALLLPAWADKCGPEAMAPNLSGDGWGYGYTDLLRDLARWRRSPYVKIDTLGFSVQGRILWELTITAPEPTSARRTVFLHARTHPGEVQSWWVLNEIIKTLLSDDSYARLLREQCVFHIVPMYNPDGVELGSPRHNANDIDLEREWDKADPQPEAVALKRRFTELMASESPIRIALNMHSALTCKRYFVYHDATGASPAYAALERHFIEGVRRTYPDGIEPWDFNITWINETPTHFPESWFWLNYRESVMALTYEDMNCESAGAYDRTAASILRGIGDYLGLVSEVAAARDHENDRPTVKHRSFNPLTEEIFFDYRLPESGFVRLTAHDLTGRPIATIAQGERDRGTYSARWTSRGLPSGLYFYRLTIGAQTVGGRLVVQR